MIYLFLLKVLLFVHLQRIINLTATPILFFLRLQNKTGLKIVNLTGLWFVIIGFVCQYIGTP